MNVCLEGEIDCHGICDAFEGVKADEIRLLRGSYIDSGVSSSFEEGFSA
jgi:hypothetical protein